jgi:hypothetical protein
VILGIAISVWLILYIVVASKFIGFGDYSIVSIVPMTVVMAIYGATHWFGKIKGKLEMRSMERRFEMIVSEPEILPVTIQTETIIVIEEYKEPEMETAIKVETVKLTDPEQKVVALEKLIIEVEDYQPATISSGPGSLQPMLIFSSKVTNLLECINEGYCTM